MNRAQWNRLLNAARGGDPEAQWEVGVHYADGVNDAKGKTLVRRNPAQAVGWYRRSAENGNVSGKNALGVCLSSGIGVAKDDKEALRWTRKAIQSGDSSAAFNLAMIYRDQEKYKQAFHWLKRAAAMGDDDALCELGQYYYFGLGVRCSPSRAVICFKKLLETEWSQVAQASRQTAMYWLGIAYLQGRGVPASVKKAKTFFKTANFDGDHLPSQEMLLVLGVEYESKRKKKA